MANPTRFDLLLFVASEPGPGTEPGWEFVRFLGWAHTRGLGVAPSAKPPQVPSVEEHPWHFPREVVRSINLVLDVAESRGRTVTVVDVARPGQHRSLVDRWVGPNGLLPLLVRPDGAQLEGSAEFDPKKIRQFIDPLEPASHPNSK
jgi:hypothetical protein